MTFVLLGHLFADYKENVDTIHVLFWICLGMCSDFALVLATCDQICWMNFNARSELGLRLQQHWHVFILWLRFRLECTLCLVPTLLVNLTFKREIYSVVYALIRFCDFLFWIIMYPSLIHKVYIIGPSSEDDTNNSMNNKINTEQQTLWSLLSLVSAVIQLISAFDNTATVYMLWKKTIKSNLQQMPFPLGSSCTH